MEHRPCRSRGMVPWKWGIFEKWATKSSVGGKPCDLVKVSATLGSVKECRL